MFVSISQDAPILNVVPHKCLIYCVFFALAVTICSGLLMFALFVSELNYYLTTEVHPELFVDTTRGQKLRINADITFPGLPCACEFVRSGARLTKAYDVTIQRYRNSHAKIENSKIHVLRCMGSKFCVKFQRCPLKFHTKFWTHTPQKNAFYEVLKIWRLTIS